MLHWADLTQYWGFLGTVGSRLGEGCWLKESWLMGPAWYHAPKDWTEFNGPKLEAALASWSSSWGSGDRHFAATSTNTSAMPRRPSEHPHCQNRAESRGWGLHLAFPVPFVGPSCPTLSATGQAVKNQSSAQKELQTTGSISK